MSNPNRYIRPLLWSVPLLAAAALAYWGFGIGNNSMAPASSTAAAPNALEVAAMTVKPQTVPIFRDLPSRTSAFKVADIRPQVSGIITQRLFEEGGAVEAGQSLYQIDPAPYKAVYDSALANLNRAQVNAKLAKAKADRYTKLVKANTVSQQAFEDVIAEHEQAAADVAVAAAAVTSARVDLNYSKVSAPISGRIGKSSVTSGALVTANQADTLATITQLDPIYVDLILPSRDLMRLRPQFENDRKLKVSLYDEAGQSVHPHEGELQFSEVTVNQTTGTVLLRALFPNPDQFLLPGMFVRAKLHLMPKEALLVPQSAAIRGGDGKLSVWVINAEGVVQPTPIVAHQSVGNNWLVESGLQNDVTIVTKGFQRLRPGATVKAVFEAQPATAKAGQPE